MAALELIPGSLVTQSGFYLVSHSNGHKSDTSAHFMEGLTLPSCTHDGCYISYTLVRATEHIWEDEDWLTPPQFMALQPAHKTKHPDDCPIVEDLVIERLERAKEAVKTSQENIRRSRDLAEETKRIREQTRRLKRKR